MHYGLIFNNSSAIMFTRKINLIKVNGFSITVLCHNPAGIYLLKVNNRNTRTRCKICSKLIKIPERRHWRGPGVSHPVLVFLLLTLKM